MDDFETNSFILEDDGDEDDFEGSLKGVCTTSQEPSRRPSSARKSEVAKKDSNQPTGNERTRTIDVEIPQQTVTADSPEPLTPEIEHPLLMVSTSGTHEEASRHINDSGDRTDITACRSRPEDALRERESCQPTSRDADADLEESTAKRVEISGSDAALERSNSNQQAGPGPSVRDLGGKVNRGVGGMQEGGVESFGHNLYSDDDAIPRKQGNLDDGSSFGGWDSQSPSESPRRRPQSAVTYRSRPLSAASSGRGSRQRASHRPKSAAAGYRKSREIRDQMSRDPRTWSASEVCEWIEHIGLGQYRKKFAHNCIDGALLMKLNDIHFKVELGIGPLGHRHMLREAIDALKSHWGHATSSKRGANKHRPQSAPLERPRRPASATSNVIPPDSHLGPSQGKVTVYEQRAKLMFALDRAQARAAHKHSIAWNMLRNAKIEEEEIRRLHGEITHLEHFHKIPFKHAYGPLDTEARVPWHPTGTKTNTRNPFPERVGTVRDHPSVDETFNPRLNRSSMMMMEQMDHSEDGGRFLDRVRMDLKERQRKKKETEVKYYCVGEPDPAQQKREKRDFTVVKDFFSSKFGTGLPDDFGEALEMIDDTVEHYPDQLGLDDQQIQRVLRSSGHKKIAVVAGAIRTMHFMDRYRNEIKTRDARRKSLQKKWYEQSLKLPSREEIEQFCVAKCKEHFSLLGWLDNSPEPVSDERLNAFLSRVKHYKEARERSKEAEVDWTKFSRDGLDELQNKINEKELRRLESDARRMAEDNKPSAVDQALAATGAAPQSVPDPPAPTVDPNDLPKNWLLHYVQLLSSMRVDDIERLEALQGAKKKAAMYRAIRTHNFLQFTQDDLVRRDTSIREAYEALKPERKIISKEQAENFFERLMEDGIRRRERLEKRIAEKKAKEEQMVMDMAQMSNQRNRKRRPASARSRR